MSTFEASVALRRFGLGPRPSEFAKIAADPRGYVRSSLARRDTALLSDPVLEPAQALHARLIEFQHAEKQARDKGAVAPTTRVAAAKDGVVAAPSTEPAAQKMTGPFVRDVVQTEAALRIGRAIKTEQPLVERLVIFWSNHFCVSGLKGANVRVMAGAFEREAIRPNVLGRFADMLQAVEHHPAMLAYLDNVQSIGPNSRAAQRNNKGLNENLAREIMELHTLGVGGGYTQADVTSFAKVITGWTVHGPQPSASRRPGDFQFAPERHEPGPQTVLGKVYQDRGLATGEDVLNDLARHPATARHIARQLARHFVGDSVPDTLISSLAKTFRDTDGDLQAVTMALVAHEVAWTSPPQKIVPPYDFLIGLVRAFEIDVKPQEVLRLSNLLGQPLWQPPSPAGWPDDDGAWMGPSAIRERLRIAERVAHLVDRTRDPRTLAGDLLGAAGADQVRQAVARAESREQGIELLIMSPEFLKR